MVVNHLHANTQMCYHLLLPIGTNGGNQVAQAECRASSLVTCQRFSRLGAPARSECCGGRCHAYRGVHRSIGEEGFHLNLGRLATQPASLRVMQIGT